MKRVVLGSSLIIGLIVLLAVSAPNALAALTFSDTTMSGSGAISIDGANTISIGTSTANSVEIGNIGNTVTINGVLTGATPLVFDGATADAFKTVFAIADPTGTSKTITFPNATGTVAVSATGPITLSAAGDIGCATCASYLTSEADPVFGASAAAGIAAGDITKWNTAYGWGNHAAAGYLTASSTDTLTNKSGNISMWTNDAGYLTSASSTLQTVASGLRGYHFHRNHRVPGAHPVARRRIFALPVGAWST